MSLRAKATYMASKVQLVVDKVQPVIDTYEDVCQMGVRLLREVQQKIAEVISKITELMAIGIEWLSKKQKMLMAQLKKQKARLMAKLQKLIAKVTAVKDKAITKIEELANKSITGISGINISVDITAPDPISGSGGSFTVTPTPDLLDEATMLVDQTLSDPTTITNSVLVVTGTAGPYPFTQITGTGVAQGLVVA